MQTPPSPIPLVLFHGLLSSPQEFGLITHWLTNNGIAHVTPHVPGYTLPTEKPAVHDWRLWESEAVHLIDTLFSSDEPVILGGLCMGGVLAAAAALKGRRKIAGLILMSPTFVYDGWGLSPIRHLRHFGYWTGLDRFFSVAEREPFGVKSPKIRKWIIKEMQERASSAVGPSRVPLTAVREGERMMAHVRTRLAELNCPILIMHAREDEITSLASVQALFDSLPAQDKSFAILENSYHMITIDNDRHEVARLMAAFVKRASTQWRLPRLAPSEHPLPNNSNVLTRGHHEHARRT